LLTHTPAIGPVALAKDALGWAGSV